MSKMVDKHSAFEYSTFKIPYETLSRKFRYSQKVLERQNLNITEAAQEVQSKLRENEEIPVEQVAPALSKLSERICKMDSALNQSLKDEMKVVDHMIKRVDYLQDTDSPTNDPVKQWVNDRESIDRLIICHLLRSGHLESARQLAEKTGIAQMCDVNLFTSTKKVEESLKRHETSTCLEWVQLHKSKLRRLNSSIEVCIRVQEVIELVRNEKRIDAVLYVNKHLRQALQDKNEHVIKLMGLIAVGASCPIASYRELTSDKRWEVLLEMFRTENTRIFQLPEQSPFSACIHTGICAFRTPACAPGGNDKCVACNPTVFALSEGLPYAHSYNSRLVCAYSGDPIDETNVPMMLATGRVYGEKAVQQLREGDMVRCPRTNTLTPVKHVQRLYVL